MHPAATRANFNSLNPDNQKKLVKIITLFHSESLSCRFEYDGSALIAIQAPGLASPKFWIDRFDIADRVAQELGQL